MSSHLLESILLFLPAFEILNLIDSHAKDKDIFITHFLPHLNVSTIQSANSQSAIHLQQRKAKQFIHHCSTILQGNCHAVLLTQAFSHNTSTVNKMFNLLNYQYSGSSSGKRNFMLFKFSIKLRKWKMHEYIFVYKNKENQ